MTSIATDPTLFVDEALDGFARAHRNRVRRVDGGIVRSAPLRPGQVAVVVGGGSGHYPAFAGVVGEGFAGAAVCGNIFASPSAAQASRVVHASEQGGGVVFAYGNYAGDVLHFGLAQEKLRSEGLDVRTVLVTDDIASAPASERHKRRGIAGDFAVFKVLGAAAERGDTIDEVERIGRKANDRTRSLGVAFGGCTLPGADHALFTVPDGMMSLGLGIHGEPGIRDLPVPDARALAALIVGELLEDRPSGTDGPGQRVSVLVNGLGTVKYEELFVLFGAASAELEAAGITIVEPEVGELVTSLDMAGASITLLWLDEELETLWRSPADTPAYRKTIHAEPRAAVEPHENTPPERVVETEPESLVAAAKGLVEFLRAAQQTVLDHEAELGVIDAFAGDGDHGAGMVLGLTAAVDAAEAHAAAGAGAAGVLAAAGDAWSDRAGGTSGALWGAALMAAASELRGTGRVDDRSVTAAIERALGTIQRLGGAVPGDKTLVDAFVPFAEELRRGVDAGDDLTAAFASAAREAEEAAAVTAHLRPRLGRARPLAEKSLGHPDAGATSFAMLARRTAQMLTERSR